jgi:RNA polymerase sigma factor (sigma-70 family)
MAVIATALAPPIDRGADRMDEEKREFEQLMQRVGTGSEEAARELFERYGHHVRRAVRKRLQQRLRRRYDSSDFTQSVWASFFQLPAERFLFPTPESLVAFLSQMACNKVMEVTRKRLGTLSHDMEREQSLDTPPPDQPGNAGEAMPAPLATPSQYAIAEERWQRMIRGLPPGHCRVLELLRDGHSHVEIAETLGVDRKVIQRLLEHLEFHLETP